MSGEVTAKDIEALSQRMDAGFTGTHGRLDAINGRVRKAEIAIAVMKFAVFTIGGGLLYAGLQVWIASFTRAAQ